MNLACKTEKKTARICWPWSVKKWGVVVPLELELNRNNNDLGEDSAVSHWETRDGVHWISMYCLPGEFNTLLL